MLLTILSIFDVEELSTHGGSLRIYAGHMQSAHKLSKNVQLLYDKEKAAGLDKLSSYFLFSEQVKETKRKILDLFIDLKQNKKTIVGYGAPAKGNTLLNFCGIKCDFLDYTVDKSPHKQGRFLPGTHIPILDPKAIEETKPDYVFILP